MQTISKFEICIEVSKKISNKSLKWREAKFKTKKMSPNLGFGCFGGHLVQTLPQAELKKII